MILFVSSTPQMQEAEPIRSMKTKFLGKLLNISITFSVNVFCNYKCYQKASEEQTLLTVNEVLLTITAGQQALSRLSRPPGHTVTTGAPPVDLYMVTHGHASCRH